MKDLKENRQSSLNASMDMNLERSKSVFSGSLSNYSRLSVQNQDILKKLQKFNNISQSVDISSIAINPLNMIEYEMQGQKSKFDPQMILAKLRKLQNRAQLHRATHEFNLLDQQKNTKHSKAKRFSSSREPNQNQKKDIKLNYMKIYQSYLKQKQIEKEHRERYEDDEVENRQVEEIDKTKDGIKYFNSLKKHSRIFDFTLSRKNAKQGITQRQIQTQRKYYLSKAVKQNKPINDYDQQKALEKQRQAKCFFENPQQIIERQITKFYLKKNPGTLSSQAEKNQRSLNLIKKQKEISFQIDEEKISQEDKKRLKNRFNDLANELARSDRRNSLEGVLPKIKESQTVKKFDLKENAKRKLFDHQ